MNTDDKAKCEAASRGLLDLRDSIARLTRVPRVLIVEDNAIDAGLLRESVLKVARVEVEVATNPLQALELFNLKPFDAVFLDLIIPGADGLDFLRKITCPNVVVIVTGHGADSPMVTEAVRLGAVMVITKPVKIDDLCKIFGGLNGC